MLELTFSGDLLSRKSQQALEAEFASLCAQTRFVFCGLAALSTMLFGKKLVVTSMVRPQGTHASKRMLDFDVDERRQHCGLSPEEAQVLSDVAAVTLAYDASRPHYPVAVYGKNDSAGRHWDHVHLQTCYGGKTKFRVLSMSARWEANIKAVFGSNTL